MKSYIYTVKNPFLTVSDLLTKVCQILHTTVNKSITVKNPFLTAYIYDIVGFRCVSETSEAFSCH